MCVAKMALRWDPDRGRVLALLPSGDVEASICTRDTGVSPSKPPPPKPSRTKRSLFVARSSMSKLPTPSSCLQLLDTVVTRDDDNESERVLYLYDQEELVHKGSYRANGVLVMVQVFMKAVIVDVLQPRMPVDRTTQRDSFELAFHFYHPGASAATRAVIRGQTELRQVVGPDRAELIASETVHELLEHIVERRSIVELETRRDRNDRDVTSLRVEFVSDRLYAKQKVTPINESLVVDQQHNDAKLIDTRHLRGVKVLSKARVLEGVPGRTIFTVFDVSATNHKDQASDCRGVQLRVDAYVISTSTRLSLSLDAADLAHVVGEDVELLSAELVAASDERRQRLATRVIEHVAIVRRHDGSLDRLYLQETVAVSTSSTLDTSALVPFGRTVRHLQRRQIVVSLSIDRSSGWMVVRLYEPQQSSSMSLAVSSQTLALLLGLEDSAATTDALLSLDKRVKTSVVGHLMAFVVLEVNGEEQIEGRLDLDQATLTSCRAALAAHEGDGHNELIERTTPQYLVQADWNGLRVLEKSEELCAVHLTLEQRVPPPKKQQLTRQHTESELSTQAAIETKKRLELDATWRLVVSVLLVKRARTETLLVTGDHLQHAIGASSQLESADDAMNALRDRLRVTSVFEAPSKNDNHEAKEANESTSYIRCHVEWADVSSE
ncbi:hypothetical protein PINS_up015616 [Pythium insidiosum]|nr:hypothetical protein PINS_up015616 [Pythium insidiosum]